METKKIGVFLETVKIGSIKKAAEKLNYTQSGLLYLINSFEHELGVHLLNRTRKGIKLSSEGQYLLPALMRIYEEDEKLNNLISELNHEGIGKLRIAAYPIFAREKLPLVVKEFISDFPDNEISIRVATELGFPTLFENNEIDLAIGEDNIIPGVEFIPLMEHEVYAAIPESFGLELRGGQSVTVDMLEEFPIIFSSYRKFNDEINERLQEGNPYIINIESPDGSVLLRMVEEGIGVTFLSEMYTDECPENVYMVPLDPPVKRELGVLVTSRKRNSPLVASFIEYLENQASLSL